MFAVIKTGGKQYRVSGKDVIEVERLPGGVGEKVLFDRVLMTGDGKKTEIGNPTVDKVVEGKIIAQSKGTKIFIQKHLRRKNSRKKTGHRQLLTRIEITAIKNPKPGKTDGS
ncbi:MAG: 50S ribosomal protein L21 [bacterium]|nr:MAG: 50S ribosomal protein L21 [bacterium]